jgi:uncharacterized protein
MLEERINRDYTGAMKARDAVRSSTLNFLRAHLKNLRIEKRTDGLEDADVTGVIKQQIKQRRDSIEQYRKGGRDDLARKESAELEILMTYLPEHIPEEKLTVIVRETIRETGGTSIKDMGSVMKALLSKVGASADNRLLSELVRRELQSQQEVD